METYTCRKCNDEPTKEHGLYCAKLGETHLQTTCQNFGICRGHCSDVVRQAPSGRWYITIGHAGFNTPRNNANGYATWQRAWSASKRLMNGGLR